LAPIWVEPPVASDPFQEALVTVMFCPDWAQLPDQPWAIFWLPV
jgi:hypothetical protein